MSVRRCQAEVDSFEFAEWYADYCIEPWDEFRADLRMALAVMQICAMKGGKRLKLEDFLLRFEPKKPKTAKDGVNILKAFAAMQNAMHGGAK